jgi:hypothetical protein
LLLFDKLLILLSLFFDLLEELMIGSPKLCTFGADIIAAIDPLIPKHSAIGSSFLIDGLIMFFYLSYYNLSTSCLSFNLSMRISIIFL